MRSSQRESLIFVRLRAVVADVLKGSPARAERTGHAPAHHAGASVHMGGDSAVGDRAPAREAEGAADERVAHLNLQLPDQQRIVGQDHLSGSRVFRKVLEEEVELAPQSVEPWRSGRIRVRHSSVEDREASCGPGRRHRGRFEVRTADSEGGLRLDTHGKVMAGAQTAESAVEGRHGVWGVVHRVVSSEDRMLVRREPAAAARAHW